MAAEHCSYEEVDVQRWRLKLGDTQNTVVEAIQLDNENYGEVVNWTQGQLVTEYDSKTNEELVGINVRGPRGMFRVSEGEYVLKFEGEFFKAGSSRFEASYERTT
jgi:hypothetical protein